jgi:mannose-6-phosphate isomerase
MEILRPDRFHVFEPVPQRIAAVIASAMNLRAWVSDCALPFWVETAQLPDGSWVEHLTLNGRPDLQAERRWRVMARQAVTYAQASLAGWYDGTDVATRSFDAYWSQGWTGTHMVHRILPDGTISDPRPDLYDHAFGLLACARMLQLTGDRHYYRHAEQIMGWIETQRHPAGGWNEGQVKPLPRRQNPHMHLLEASLALYEATGSSADLGIARHVMGLFERHFLRGEVVGEFFEQDWTPHATHGDVVEPGHAVEWIWLLTRYDAATGADHAAACHALYDRAFRQRLGTLYDEETFDGELVRQTTRTWVQTEAVKAHLAMLERGTPGAAGMAAATLEAMTGTFLQPDGTWIDQINACGAPVAKTIPVSTMYHILVMAIEADRVAAQLR